MPDLCTIDDRWGVISLHEVNKWTIVIIRLSFNSEAQMLIDIIYDVPFVLVIVCSYFRYLTSLHYPLTHEPSNTSSFSRSNTCMLCVTHDLTK